MYTLNPGEARKFIFIEKMDNKAIEESMKKNGYSNWFVRVSYYSYYSNPINIKNVTRGRR